MQGKKKSSKRNVDCDKRIPQEASKVANKQPNRTSKNQKKNK